MQPQLSFWGTTKTKTVLKPACRPYLVLQQLCTPINTNSYSNIPTDLMLYIYVQDTMEPVVKNVLHLSSKGFLWWTQKSGVGDKRHEHHLQLNLGFGSGNFVFTWVGFSIFSGFIYILCSQKMDSVINQVSQNFCVHQRFLYMQYGYRRLYIYNPVIKRCLPFELICAVYLEHIVTSHFFQSALLLLT